MSANDWTPEMLELAQRVIQRQDEEACKFSAMTDSEKREYIRRWAERLAGDLAGLND